MCSISSHAAVTYLIPTAIRGKSKSIKTSGTNVAFTSTKVGQAAREFGSDEVSPSIDWFVGGWEIGGNEGGFSIKPLPIFSAES